MRRRGDRHQFGDALDNAQHGDFRIAERDKPGVDPVGAGVGHGLRRPLETRAIAGKGINRLGFYSSRQRRSATLLEPAFGTPDPNLADGSHSTRRWREMDS